MNSPASLGAGDRHKTRPQMFSLWLASLAGGHCRPSSRKARLLRSASPLAGDGLEPPALLVTARHQTVLVAQCMHCEKVHSWRWLPGDPLPRQTMFEAPPAVEPLILGRLILTPAPAPPEAARPAGASSA